MSQSVSIITICFNNLPELIKTCTSVDEQTLLPNEHLIVDGSTNEEIVHWLNDNTQLHYRRWIHDRDKGIADAFNKGLHHATGTITHLLNSGDCYFTKNALATVLPYFEADPQLMWTHAQYVQHRGDVDVVSGAPFEKDKLWKGMRTVAHPTMFIKKEVYKRHGYYNLDFKIAMDYDMLVRIRNEKFCFITQPLIYFAPGGTSNVHFEKGLEEVKKAYTAAGLGNNFKLMLWQNRQRLLHAVMQSSIGKKWFQLKNKRQIIKQ